MTGGVPVITAPAEIDTTTAGELRAVLLEWQRRGHTTVVVDLTGTEFCDSTGLRELVWAHKRAVADGGGLRLVTLADGAFMRIFTVTGLDGILPRCATVAQALAQAPASRDCAQCGTVFVPKREHARFCGGDCRAAWNREHLGDPAAEAGALTWSVAAMSEATARLRGVKASDRQQALAAIGEAVWWITMVDATLVRHYPVAYDSVLAGHTPAKRRLIVETLAGLRFVRTWISRGAALDEAIETAEGAWHVTGWTWKPAGEPAPAWLPLRAQAWERIRYRAYQARLAGHAIGATFGEAVAFLTLTGADVAASQPAAQATRRM
jgi:anti-sigma B factor antagonist